MIVMNPERKTCGTCNYLADFSGSPFADVFKDGVHVRCMKESRKGPDGYPPPVKEPFAEYCEQYLVRDPLRDQWEWDENKNQTNIAKHNFSFAQAIEAMKNDPYCFRQPVGDPAKWEDLEGLDFDRLGIPRTKANQDPVRDMYLFMMDGKLFKMITTLRGERGQLKHRVISVHRASSKTESLAYEWAREQIKNGARFV